MRTSRLPFPPLQTATKVENVMKATHLVAGGEGVPFKRTPKLLAGMGRCCYVVDVAWLHESAEKRQVLDGLEYILCDTEVTHANILMAVDHQPIHFCIFFCIVAPQPPSPQCFVFSVGA